MKAKEIKQKMFRAYLALSKESNAPIQVRKITEAAGIARSTFYSHYDNIDQLVVDMENDFLYGIEEIFKQHPLRRVQGELSVPLLPLAQFLSEQSDTFQALLTSEDGQMFREKLSHTLKLLFAQSFHAQSLPYQKPQLTFAVAGLLSLTEFFKDGQGGPELPAVIEEYSRLLSRIFSE